MSRYIDADYFARQIEDVIKSQRYDELVTCEKEFPTVADVLATVVDELRGKSLNGFELCPTADVRPNVHGEWLIDKYNAEFCSVCGKHPYNDGEYYVVGWDSDFCPHCGANMRSATTASNTKGGWDGEYYLEDC